MKKFVAAMLSVLMMASVMASCNSGNSSAYKDGSYRVEAENFDDHGWKEFVNVTVKDGKITEVEFDAENEEDGHLKTEDEAYKEAYTGAGFETYPADYTEKLESGLIEKQDAEKVDSVAGATTSSTSFKAMVKELQKAMKQGKTDTIVFKGE